MPGLGSARAALLNISSRLQFKSRPGSSPRGVCVPAISLNNTAISLFSCCGFRPAGSWEGPSVRADLLEVGQV